MKLCRALMVLLVDKMVVEKMQQRDPLVPLQLSYTLTSASINHATRGLSGSE